MRYADATTSRKKTVRRGRAGVRSGKRRQDTRGHQGTIRYDDARLRLALVASPARRRSAAVTEPVTFVACAPGYPGSTAEAQPVMDGFAAALAEAMGSGRGSVRAEYYEDEARGLERLARADVGFALVPLPFFLKHEAGLKLDAVALAVAEGGRVQETWASSPGGK